MVDDILHRMGTDASKWAEEFCKLFSVYVRDHNPPTEMDDAEGLMIGWFANAIEAGALREAREAEPVTSQIAVIPALHKALEGVVRELDEGTHQETKIMRQARAALTTLDTDDQPTEDTDQTGADQ